jgi:hypothetical protein
MPLDSLIVQFHPFYFPTFSMLSRELLEIITTHDHNDLSSNLAKLSMPAETGSNGSLVAARHGCRPDHLGEGV